MSQFSLFGAAVAEPSLDDLAGVVLAGGHWVRQPAAARLSIVVADFWRAEALAAEFAARGVAGDDPIVSTTEAWSARTAFAPSLAEHAARWSRGANQGPPTGFVLSPGGLRLWAIAAGAGDDAGFLFATDRADSSLHLAAGAQLSRLGLAAVSMSQRPGPGWRITSIKRLRRLAELLGEPPVDAGADWPT